MMTIARACLFALSLAAAAAANAQMSYADGAALMAKYNCQSCHAMNQTLAGPSLVAIAKKYSSDPNAPAYLEAQVLNGSMGVWGGVPMAPVNVPDAQLAALIGWILQLSP